jgi:outer membrane biosynthesis protein TonB
MLQRTIPSQAGEAAMPMIEPRNFTPEADRAQRALQFPVGVVSPLWLLYAGAAGAGMAYWWMTRWAKPVNLEALLGAGKAAATAVVEAAAPIAESVIQTTEAAEQSLEAAVEEVAEAEQAPVLEAAPPPELPFEAPAVEVALEPAFEPAPVIEPELAAAPEPALAPMPESVPESGLEPDPAPEPTVVSASPRPKPAAAPRRPRSTTPPSAKR